MDTLSVKGVTFRLDGLPPAASDYLRGKLKRSRKREGEASSLFHRLLGALLPAGYARVPVESLVSGRVLVVGCAGGIETLGLGAVGLDVDRDALRVASALGRHAVEARAGFLAASGADLPFRDGHFDALMSDNVVEHIPAALLPRHLKEARRVLRDGGRYVFTTPNRLFENPPKEGHISLRSYAEWEALAREAGFSSVLTPLRRSGPLGDLAWKKAKEAGSPSRLGLSHKGLRMVTLVALK
ncbi:MAG TPA: methyltransferase domain-containing protein [Planctomycetota bacterium]